MLTFASSVIYTVKPFGQAALATWAFAIALENVHQSLMSTNLADAVMKKRLTFAFLARHRIQAFRVRALRAL